MWKGIAVPIDVAEGPISKEGKISFAWIAFVGILGSIHMAFIFSFSSSSIRY